SAILFTEGIGVYMQQRWAEFFMIFATATFIPIEIRHLWHRPGLVGALILLANCFIVWFLYRVLKRDKARAHIARQRQLAETRQEHMKFATRRPLSLTALSRIRCTTSAPTSGS